MSATYPHMKENYKIVQVVQELPNRGWIKCASDRALIANDQRASCGGVLSDEHESCMGSHG